MNKNLHNSVLYIDMGQLRRNAEAILQELGGAQLIPVLKGNAYGLGLEEVGAALAAIPEIRTMAVARCRRARPSGGLGWLRRFWCWGACRSGCWPRRRSWG